MNPATTPAPDIRAAIVAEARTWIGTPYHHHARLRGVGVDCAQILIAVFEACGLVRNVQVGDYAREWHMHRSEEMYAEWLDVYGTRIEDPQPGDVALFRFGRTFSHGAIIVGGALATDLEMVHAYVNRGVIGSRLTEDPLQGRPVQFWRIGKAAT